ncbi:uncharacterized protein [Miscanthus floridulus]|uniref:uncharacterized protein n=1 Tax=Miscanthus floridulus TaxID=154761 RepID=UPI0034581FD0
MGRPLFGAAADPAPVALPSPTLLPPPVASGLHLPCTPQLQVDADGSSSGACGMAARPSPPATGPAPSPPAVTDGPAHHLPPLESSAAAPMQPTPYVPGHPGEPGCRGTRPAGGSSLTGASGAPPLSKPATAMARATCCSTGPDPLDVFLVQISLG